MSKYHSTKCSYNGISFDSKKERDRYCELLLLEKAGKISGLKLQVPFELIPKQKGERSTTYKADFVYREGSEMIVEDVKGYKTDVYKIKRKLFKWRYPEYIFREYY